MEKILVTDTVHLLLLEGFENAGYGCDYEPEISAEEVQAKIDDYVGLIVNSKILADKTLIDKAKKLRFIGRLGSGREVVDIPYASSKGIGIFFSPEGNSNAVAEHALGMLLALANNLLRADYEVRQKIWQREKNRGWELRGKTIGIIGFGHTGKAFAAKLKSMEMNIIAYDKYLDNFEEKYNFVLKKDLNYLLENADIISFHLPLTAETKYFCDTAFLKKCKQNVVLINTSRGNVIDTKALLEALKSGQIKGACLDVFENEKVQTFSQEEEKTYAELYNHINVVMSPHIAGWTKESKQFLAQVLLTKILTFERGNFENNINC
jgi:D-3-phosphoglycerate dehydrogenase / 2-oxoglutarate reductase